MIRKLNKTIKCNGVDCENIATYEIAYKKSAKVGGLYLCNDCATEIYLGLAKNIVPKSPRNILNKKITK